MINSTTHQSNHPRRIIRWVVICLVGVFGLAAAYMIISGRLAVVVKQPVEVVSINSVVCDGALIKKYNDAFSVEKQDDHTKRLAAVADDIKKLENANRDPNCSYMQYIYNLEINNFDAAQINADQLVADAQSGDYISGQINNPMGIELIEKTVTWAKQAPANKSTGDTSQGALN